MPETTAPIVGVLLAGGLSRRMGGGDKCFHELAGRPLLAHAIDRARPQVATLVLNANGDAGRFAAYELPFVADSIPDFAGPLAGVLAALEWTQTNFAQAEFVASFPSDAPFFPEDLVARLHQAVRDGGADTACARSGGRTHPVFGLWPLRLAGALRSAMVDEGLRRIDSWTARYRHLLVDYPDQPRDPFFNINSPADAEAARALVT